MVNKESKPTTEEKVECNRCGDCCRTLHLRIPVADNINPEVLRTNIMFYWNLHEGVHSSLQKNKEGKYFIHMTILTDCSMLLEHRDGTCTCKIYPMRPPICRSWPRDYTEFRGSNIPICSMLLDPVTGKYENKLREPTAMLKRAENEE